MADTYNPLESEKKWQEFWEQNQINKYEENSAKPTYSIDTPPPTVSGKIHIWHIFSYTQAEVIARFKRMSWYNLYYPFGFDDNWLPTEILVEKETWKRATVIWRLEFVKECLKTTEFYREKFKDLWQSVWLSVDWDLKYSTISAPVQTISQKSFLNLLKKGFIYKKNSPSLWCTKCGTSVAQAEVEDKELDWIFFQLKFQLEDGWDVLIATTRPELLPACLAVFVNPTDERYKSYIWKNIITPLWTKVKILSDEKVSIEKWTWVVMCCSYWDETDLYWIQTYNLPEKIIVNTRWVIVDTGIEGLDWLKLKEAKSFIVEMLKAQDKISSQTAIVHSVWTHERCGTPVEIIPVWQWFIKVIDQKERLLALADEIKWNPEYMKKRYIDWVENLKWDWCISRQRYFGIPVPIWYSKKTWEVILPSESQLPIDPLKDLPDVLPAWHTADDIIPESDVLDTWATSSLTPIINGKWQTPTVLEQHLKPMTLRPQAHDIIRTWAFYTIVMSMYHNDTIPFENIMISGHVLAWKWEKISKSKNNAWKSPEELIQLYWADSLRYWACGWGLWKNIILDEEEIKKWRKLLIKLWNSAKFVSMNLQDFDPKQSFDIDKLQPLDNWLLLKINQLWERMKTLLNDFEFWLARIEFEDFFWRVFCDQYLEIVKDKIYNFDKYENWVEKKLSAQYALYNTLYALLRLISPLIPHITEELYQLYFKEFEWVISIHKTSYEIWLKANWTYSDLNKQWELLLSLVDEMRKTKTLNWIKLWQAVSKIIITDSAENINILKQFSDDIKGVSKSQDLEFIVWDEKKIEIENLTD